MNTPTLQTPAGQIQRHANEIRDVKLFETCMELTTCPEFLTWPAAISMHHAYEGGLITHTFEVIKHAKMIAFGFKGVNEDVLIAAALWHDYGKIFEYQKVPFYAAVDSRTRHLPIGNEAWIRDSNVMSHIISSTIHFVVAASIHGVDRATKDAVVHCILAHHGPVREWGSPEAPRTIEALILHQADMLSASYGATKVKP
jgi:3'-5' exoribonuclease